MNDLKKVVFQVVQSEKEDVKQDINATVFERLYGEENSTEEQNEKLQIAQLNLPNTKAAPSYSSKPDADYVYSKKDEFFEEKEEFHEIEEEEESLSISETEKKLIKKALVKHNGKRKYASEDLGISERTLYRKIKEYDIEQ